MIKYVGIVWRRPGLSFDQFNAYWRTNHGPLAAQLPGLRRYVQNPPLQLPGREPKCDGLAELWFDDLDSLRAAWHTPEGQRVRQDEPNLVDLDRSFALICQERPILPGEGLNPPLKFIGVLHRRDGLSPAECDAYWREHHAELAKQLPGLRRYVQNPPLQLPGREPKCDGLAEVWFDDLESFRAAWRSPEGQRLSADEPNLADLARSFALICTERVVVG